VRTFKIGDAGKCDDCKKDGFIVALQTDLYDPTACPPDSCPLEISAYDPEGTTCIDCERSRFRRALPKRGTCAWCGALNPRAIKDDAGATRSFCDDECISNYINARLQA